MLGSESVREGVARSGPGESLSPVFKWAVSDHGLSSKREKEDSVPLLLYIIIIMIMVIAIIIIIIM